LAWAVAEDQAAGELVVAAEPAGVAALGRRGAVELGGLVAPAYGNLVVRRVAEAAREQVPVARVAEVEQVAGLDQEPAAEVGVEAGQQPEAALRLQVASPCRLESG